MRVFFIALLFLYLPLAFGQRLITKQQIPLSTKEIKQAQTLVSSAEKASSNHFFDDSTFERLRVIREERIKDGIFNGGGGKYTSSGNGANIQIPLIWYYEEF